VLCLLGSCAAFAATEEQINKTFPIASGGKLVVDVDIGSIEVITNAVSSEVDVDVWRKITRKSKEEEEQFLRGNRVLFQHEGRTLMIRSRSNEKKRWFSGRWNRNEAKYTIRVPAQFSAKLNTSGGGIAVSDLPGDVTADTSGGGLRFTRVHGPLVGDTSGGGIHVVDCAGAIKVDTSGGSIEVTGSGGSLQDDTEKGQSRLLENWELRNAALPPHARSTRPVSSHGGGGSAPAYTCRELHRAN
jgi:hypothetical protein